MARGKNTAKHPKRQVHREKFPEHQPLHIYNDPGYGGELGPWDTPGPDKTGYDYHKPFPKRPYGVPGGSGN